MHFHGIPEHTILVYLRILTSPRPTNYSNTFQLLCSPLPILLATTAAWVVSSGTNCAALSLWGIWCGESRPSCSTGFTNSNVSDPRRNLRWACDFTWNRTENSDNQTSHTYDRNVVQQHMLCVYQCGIHY